MVQSIRHNEKQCDINLQRMCMSCIHYNKDNNIPWLGVYMEVDGIDDIRMHHPDEYLRFLSDSKREFEKLCLLKRCDYDIIMTKECDLFERRESKTIKNLKQILKPLRFCNQKVYKVVR